MIRTNDYAKLSANAYDGSFIPRGYTLVGQRFNTESGALFTFDALGIAALNLVHESAERSHESDNWTTGVGNFARADGGT